MEDVRKADYKKQAEVCLALRKHFLQEEDCWNDDMFVERFMETSENITPEDIDDSIEWVGYAVNDLDNAITVIDRNDPMTFFHIALKLEKILKESWLLMNDCWLLIIRRKMGKCLVEWEKITEFSNIRNQAGSNGFIVYWYVRVWL